MKEEEESKVIQVLGRVASGVVKPLIRGKTREGKRQKDPALIECLVCAGTVVVIVQYYFS